MIVVYCGDLGFLCVVGNYCLVFPFSEPLWVGGEKIDPDIKTRR